MHNTRSHILDSSTCRRLPRIARSIPAMVLALTLLTSCNSSGTFSGYSRIAPPTWLQGTWGATSNDELFRITSNNVVMVSVGTELDYRELSRTIQVSDETPTADTYLLKLRSADVYQTLAFNLKGSTTLTFTLTTNGISTILDLVKH